MSFISRVGDFFRTPFESDEETKRRKQREAQEARQRQLAAQKQPKPQTLPQDNRPTQLNDMFGQKPQKDPMALTKKPEPQKPAPIAPRAAPLPDQEFKGISEGEGKNKTVFGKNAAWFLPKSLEKTAVVKADRNVKTNTDKYVAQYDQLHPDKQKVLVNQAKEMAAKGDVAATNTLKALNDTGRLKGNAADFLEGSNEKLIGGLTRSGLRTADLLLPGKNTWGLEQEADRQDASKRGKKQITTAGKAGEIAGNIQKGAVDLATIVIPTSKIDKLAEANKVIQTLEDGSKIMQIAGKLVKVVPGSLAGSAIDAVQTKGRGDDVNVGKSAATGLGVDLAMELTPWGRIFGGAKKLIGKSGSKAVTESVDDVAQTIDGLIPEATNAAKAANSEETRGVIQVINNETKTKRYIAPGDAEYQKALKEIDNSRIANGDATNGTAGVRQNNGDVYHITNRTPQEMEARGFTRVEPPTAPAEDFAIADRPGKPIEDLDNTPAYERKIANQEAEAAQKAADEAFVPNTAVDDVPSYRHNQQIKQVVEEESKKFEDFVNGNPDLTQQQVETARAATEARIIKLTDELKATRQASLDAVQAQADAVDATVANQADVNATVQAEQAAATAPVKGTESTPAPSTGEVAANDAYTKFNEEHGLTADSQDVTYVDAEQALEEMAGNKTIDDLTGRQALRIPGAINAKTQGAVADAASNATGTLTGKMLTSQNPIANFFGQTLYGLNKKSTLNNAQKTLVEQVRGRQGGVGNLTEQVVSNIETPIKALDETAQANIKEKVFKAFELFNNGEPDTASVIIRSFTPEERAYFDGVRKLNILRNNINRDTMAPDLIEKYANGMHMPRLFDFTDDSVEAYAQASGRTLDLNPTKRRKQLEELSQELQQKMLRDPAQASAIRTDVALHNKAVSDYSASVTALPGAVSDVPARGFLEIPDQPKYGNAAGKYVRRDLAEPMLTGDNRFKSESYKAVNKLLDGYQSTVLGKLENGLRKALTIYNPATRLGNRGANLTQGAMAGFNLPEMAVSQQHFMNVLKSGGDEWTRLAKTFGAIDDNTALARFSGAVNPDAGTVTKGLTQSYENVDNAAKVAMFKWRINKGSTPEEAARFVNRALPNIGNSGEIYSFFSKLPVLGVPFRAIQPEVIRSVSSSAARNTVPFLVAMGTYTTLQNMSWEGVPEEERKQIQERFGAGQTPFAGINGFFGDKGIQSDKVLPSSWSFNAGALFGKDKEGDSRVVDVDPRRLMGMYSINLGGESATDSVIDQGLKASPANIPVNFNNGDWNFAPQNIVGSRLFSPAYQAAIDRDFRGKSVQDPEGKIYNPDGTISLKYQNPDTGRPDMKTDKNRLLQFLGRSYVPQANDIANLKDAKDGKENFMGQTMNLPQAVSRLFGLKGEEFTDQRLQDMRDTGKYFNEKAEIDKMVEGLSDQDAEAYKRLTGYYKLRDKQVPNEFASDGSMRDTKAPQYEFGEDKWKEYAAHPNLYQLMVDKKQKDAAANGTPIQPEFDPRLSEAFRKQIIQNKMVAPGDDAELDQRMYSSPEWDYYQNLKKEYKDAASKYYPDSGNGDYTDELVKHQDAKFPDKPPILKAYSAANQLYYDGKTGKKPDFTENIKAAKEEYNKQTFMWTNTERAARGLPAITWDVWNNPSFGFDANAGGGYGGGGSNYNPADHVNNFGELTNLTAGVKRYDPVEAQALPNLGQFFGKFKAGSGGGKVKPKLGASASGR